MNFVFLGMFFLSLDLIFGQIEAISGWTKDSVAILILTTALFSDFLWTFVHLNLMNFSELIRRGSLDFVLLKPLNSRFLVSVRYLEFDHYLRMPVLVYLINKRLLFLGLQVNLFSWAAYFFLFFLGFFILYNFFFSITITNFWFTRIFNLSDIFNEVIEIGRFPVTIFPKGIRVVFTYLIPSIFVAYFPTLALLGRGGPVNIVLTFLAAALSWYFSQAFWKYALKFYQGASS